MGLYERAVTVDLFVETNEGANFTFRHEVCPVATLDAAIRSAEEALKQFAQNLVSAIH
jgi:hypothetical protein